MTPVSVNDSFEYTDKAAHKVFHLYSSVCIYRTKAQTMAIGFQRENKVQRTILSNTNILPMYDPRLNDRTYLDIIPFNSKVDFT